MPRANHESANSCSLVRRLNGASSLGSYRRRTSTHHTSIHRTSIRGRRIQVSSFGEVADSSSELRSRL